MEPIRQTHAGVEVRVWAVPGTSRDQVVGLHDGMVKIRVAADAEGGKANRAISDLIASKTGCAVDLVKGMKSRSKVFVVAAEDVENVRRRLGV